MSDCLFCKIIKGEIPGKFVYKDERVVAFSDINPKAPVHILVLPVKHIESVNEISNNDKDLMGELLLKVKEIARKLGIDKSGYKLIANNGKGAGQLIFHLHFHLLGGWNEKPEWEV